MLTKTLGAVALFLAMTLPATAQTPVQGPVDIGGGDSYYYQESIGTDFAFVYMTFFGPDFPANGETYVVYTDLYGNVSVNLVPEMDQIMPEMGPSTLPGQPPAVQPTPRIYDPAPPYFGPSKPINPSPSPSPGEELP